MVGLIAATRQAARAFSDDDIRLLTSFADQAVIAIENVRLFDQVQARTRELEEALERQEASAEILRVISRSPTDPRPVFARIVETAARVLGCDTAAIMLCEGIGFRIAAVATPQGQVAGFGQTVVSLDPAANFPSRAIIDKKMLHLPDWSQIDLPEGERNIREKLGVNSSLYLPLLRDAVCIGLLTLVGRRANSFG